MLQAVTQIDLIPAADSWQGSPPPVLLPSLGSSPLVPGDGAHRDNYIISGQSRSPPRLWGQITLPDTDTCLYCLYCLVWWYPVGRHRHNTGLMQALARNRNICLLLFLGILSIFGQKITYYLLFYLLNYLVLGFGDRYTNCEALDSWASNIW